MDASGENASVSCNPVLEPVTGPSQLSQTLQIVKGKANKREGPPRITAPPPANSALLARVRNFLPEMARAESELNARVSAGENVDVEDVCTNGTHIEMNVGLVPEGDGTSDSDSDSSQSHEDANNEFTSDSDLDSSSSSSSTSNSSSQSGKIKMPGQGAGPQKRPMIQVLDENSSPEGTSDSPNEVKSNVSDVGSSKQPKTE